MRQLSSLAPGNGRLRLRAVGLASAVALATAGLGTFAYAATAAKPPLVLAPKATPKPAAPVRPSAAAPAAASSAKSAPVGYADLADRLLPMVVNISTSQTLKRTARADDGPALPEGSPLDDFFKNFTDRGDTPERVQSLGSGFIIDPAGYIVTNNHVIEGADEITVILTDGSSLKAKLVGHDDKTDLALLKVEARKPLPTAKFGDSDKARIGDLVMAIGDPFGLGGSVTTGIVSARNRDINSGPYDDFIQTDAPINKGNSGGPLFNMDGEVIGINSAIYSPSGGSVGIGFSISSNEAKNIIAQLRRGGAITRGWLGVRIQQVTNDIAESIGLDSPKGALIAGVTSNGPAAKAGVQNGDVVLTFGGRPVADSRALPRMVADASVGRTVDMEVLRKGQHKIIPVTVQRLVEDDNKVASADKPAPKAAPKVPAQVGNLGLTVAPITPDARRRYRLAPGLEGVVVTDVDPESPAGQKNIKPGDVITEVAQEKVATPQDVTAKLDAEKKAGHKVVLLQVSRDGELTFIGVRTP